MIINKKITKTYQHTFNISKAGLTAIFISARCKSKKQINSNIDENLRIEINNAVFREIPPRKNIQIYNIPPAFNGSKLKGNKKTVVFLTVLKRGKNVINLIPNKSAFVEEIKIQKLSGEQNINFNIEEKGEDGNNLPWYTFALIDLPLNSLSADITIAKKFWDSDDLKIIINGKVKKNIRGGKYKFWCLAGGFLGWLIWAKKGESKKEKINFLEKLDTGIHYIEFWRDRMPILHNVSLSLKHTETKAQKRAANLIKDYAGIIIDTAREYKIDSTIIGAVIYQEQTANVNFVDRLTDYIGGLLGINTSIGIGQVRINTAKSLETYYHNLNIFYKENGFANSNIVRVERLKDPLTNIRYVAAKIHFSLKRWKEAGYNIENKPDIIGTLYNIENVSKPIKPHAKPKANDFGKGVKKNYNRVKKLLGL